MRAFIDFETRSKLDIKRVGASRYSRGLDSLLCMAYWIDCDEDTRLWKPGDDDPEDLLMHVACDLEVHAFNAAFERQIWNNYCVPVLGWPSVKPEQWRCTAAKAAACALPRSLADAATVLRARVQKDMGGKRVMLQLAKPRKPSKADPHAWYTPKRYPDKFKKLYSYCTDDVRSEKEVDRLTPSLSVLEETIYQLDQKINERGVPIDIEFAKAATQVWQTYKERGNEKIEALTDGKVKTATSTAKLKAWVSGELGEELGSIDKATVSNLLRRKELPENVREVLDLRKEVSRSSNAKYVRMIETADEDGRIRNVHMYHGATTGRWAGRTVQFQNVPSGGLEEWEVDAAIEHIKNGDQEILDMVWPETGALLSGLLRGAVCATPGNRLIVADFASVEARGIAWLAGEERLLEQFRNQEPIYKVMASEIYGCDVDEVTKPQRQLGKAAVLGCGYGMGWRKFATTCKSWGIEIDNDLAEHAVTTYREAYPAIPRFWKRLDEAAKEAIEKPGTSRRVGKIKFFVSKGWLWCGLPSGRRLAYRSPRIGKRPLPSPPFDPGAMGRTVDFVGIGINGKPQRQHTYGGKLAENITQAVCRDLLAEAMLRLEDAGYPIVMHVHDEVVCHCSNGSLSDVIEIMKDSPKWAEGFPVDAEGFEAQRFRKD